MVKKSFNETSNRSAARYRLVDFYTIRETVSQKTVEAGGAPVTEQLIRDYHFHKGGDPSRPKEPYAEEWKQTGADVAPLGTKKLAELDPGDVRDAYQALVIFGGWPDPLNHLLNTPPDAPPAREPGAIRKFLNSFRP